MNKQPTCPEHSQKLTRRLGDGWVRCPATTAGGAPCLYTRNPSLEKNR